METNIEFKEFKKIPRLNRNCLITEKIDGTNGLICITEDGQFLTGSRSRWITPKDDNYGFSKWAHENKDELMQLGVGYHYGEWWGKGIQRNYGLNERRFSLFNAGRWCMHNEEPKQINTQDPRIIKMQERAPVCCRVVPVLYDGLFTTEAVKEAIENLRVNGSYAARFDKPEGIIVYHVAANQYFKVTIEKDDERKGA